MRNTLYVMALMFALCGASEARAADKTLDNIEPVGQETDVWCWLAVSEMVLKSFEIKNMGSDYQCEIFKSLEGSCPREPAQSLSRLTSAVERYSRKANKSDSDSPIIIGRESFSLSKQSVMQQIDRGIPIVATITPVGKVGLLAHPMHVALIVGYEDDGDYLIVNDPFDFTGKLGSNPYAAFGTQLDDRGQYRIDFKTFNRDFDWKESVTFRKRSGS